MKLYDLCTEGLRSKTLSPFRRAENLSNYATRASRAVKQTPNPREIKIKRIIREVYEDIWGDYHDDPRALSRINSYKNSIIRHMSRFLDIQDEKSLRLEIETLFRARAERIAFQDPQ